MKHEALMGIGILLLTAACGAPDDTGLEVETTRSGLQPDCDGSTPTCWNGGSNDVEPDGEVTVTCPANHLVTDYWIGPDKGHLDEIIGFLSLICRPYSVNGSGTVTINWSTSQGPYELVERQHGPLDLATTWPGFMYGLEIDTGTSGNFIHRIQHRAATVTNGNFTGNLIGDWLPWQYGIGLGPNFVKTCQGGRGLRGMTVWLNNNQKIRGLQLLCTLNPLGQ